MDAGSAGEPARAGRRGRRRRERADDGNPRRRVLGIPGRVVRRAIVLAVVVAAGWSLFAFVELRRAIDEADAGRARLERLRDGLADLDDLLDEEFADELVAARAEFDAAHERLSKPALRPALSLPVVGRQITSARDLAATTSTVLDVASTSRARAADVLELDASDPGERVAMLDEMVEVIDDARAQLDGVDLGPDDALFAQLADARIEVADQLDEVETTLDDAAVILAGLRDLVAGPRTYLLLATNNSEMRSGSGMVLSIGEVSLDDGEIDVGRIGPVSDVELRPGLDVGGDLEDRWGFLEPEQYWQNLMASPRFPANAELASRMWERATGSRVDGVFAIDPVALAAIMAVTGDVVVDGDRLTAETVEQFLLHDQYTDVELEVERIELLAKVAASVVDSIRRGGWDPIELAEALGRARDGRHLLAWSRDEVEQSAFETLDADGSLGPDSLVVSVLNRGANKLDHFLHLTVDGDVDEVTDDPEGTVVRLAVTIRNETPVDEPTYVQGPAPVFDDLDPGDYVGILAIHAPGDVSYVRIDDVDALAVVGPDGPTFVVGHQFTIARDEVITFDVEFAVPRTSVPLVVEPSARRPAVQWSLGDEQFWDVRRRTVELSAG